MKGNFIADSDLILTSAQTVNSDAAGNVSAGYVDLGTNYIDYPSVLGVFFLGTTDFGDGDEIYEFKIQFSNVTNFATIEGEYSVTCSSAAEIERNNSTLLVPARATGQYVRCFTDVTGTTPSVVIDKAFLTKE